MKTSILIYCLLTIFNAAAQEKENISSVTEQQLENLAIANETGANDDSYLQEQAYFKKHPLNINIATASELQELNVLSGLQVEQLIAYRKLLGKLINLYELQAIPSWDISSIKNVLPFITVTDDKTLLESMKDRWRGGDEILLTRYSRILEKSKGYYPPADSAGSRYLGSRDKLYFRYTYNYKNLLQWGVLGDKDPGEQFFRGYQQQGFDFYSFHFFVRQLRVIKSIAIGDFTVNFGQGLVQWQSLAFRKSTAVLNIKRQSATLRPYNSAGEYNFNRGIGITLQKRKWETTLFASYKKISANNIIDSAFTDGAVSSFQQSGYHRTTSENAGRNSLRQAAAGANVRYDNTNFHVGTSFVYNHFSKLLQQPSAPYHLFSLQGVSLMNASIDYSFTLRNMHFFGEAASDNKYNLALLQGALISLDAKIDASFLYRKISRGYRSLNSNAFTENTDPVNEEGLYAGLSVRPVSTIRIDAYADVFRFPWLKYRVDQPSNGQDYLVQLTYTSNKLSAWYVRYKQETKMINRSGNTATTSIVDRIPTRNLRVQAGTSLDKTIDIKSRIELSWYDEQGSSAASQGFLTYLETSYKPNRSHWQGNARLQYFETDGYNARIYGYESDMPYNFSIPFFYGKGMRYYFNLNWDGSYLLNKKIKRRWGLDCWLRWSQTIYANQPSIGSGLDLIKGNHHSEIKAEIILTR